MVSIDLKDAYLLVPINERDRKYLRFTWEDRMYEFQCLPFGLSSAQEFSQSYVTSDGPPQTEGVTEHHFLRRYAADGRSEARSGMPVAGSPVPTQAAGLQGQLGKVPVTSNAQAAASLTKYNYQFDEGPKGPKLNCGYMSETSKCYTARPPSPSVFLSLSLFFIQGGV